MLLLALVLLNVWTTSRIVHSDIVEPSKKVIQILLVWLVPILMAALVLVLNNENRPRNSRLFTKDDSDSDIDDIGDIVEVGSALGSIAVDFD